MLGHVLDTARSLEPRRIHVVVGHGADQVRAAAGQDGARINWVVQHEQKGTAHAVAQALPEVGEQSTVLVTFGDAPLVCATTLRECAAAAEQDALALVTARFSDPAELGRIVRDSGGAIRAIVEFADADAGQRGIDEINSGILAMPGDRMKALVAEIEPHNAQAEYYLTDLVALAVERNIPVIGLLAQDPAEVMGVNDRAQLAEAERICQNRCARQLMCASVRARSFGIRCLVTGSLSKPTPWWKGRWWQIAARWDPLPAFVPARSWAKRFASVISWRPRRRLSGGAPRPATSPTWATPLWVKIATWVPAR
jgi:bifunctional UDP-N-acetylglucosamine pyrophosphorylase/glucosamine-1-phosphate N-acetyltransferase